MLHHDTPRVLNLFYFSEYLLGARFCDLPHAQLYPVLQFDHLPLSALLGALKTFRDREISSKVIIDNSKTVQFLNSTKESSCRKAKMPEDDGEE